MAQVPEGIHTRAARLEDPADAKTFQVLLNAYAQDPMGAGKGLPDAVLRRAARDLARHPAVRVFFAETAAGPCGFATCFLGYSTFRASPLLNVHDLSVLPAYRGQGIGRQLLATIERQARIDGCCKLTLEVREDNPTAAGLYRSEGFQAGQGNPGSVQYYFLEKALETAQGPE